jgi:replication factor C small subunit
MDIFLEKYRPQKFEDVVGNKEIIDRIKAMVESNNIPHLLFEGTAGTGKTTLAYVIGKTLFGENFRNNFLELNASDERGIDVVRDTIKSFAKTQPLDFDFKIILLDEADSMTKDAQEALRRVMERYSNNTRFIICCNRVDQLIDPIISRCQKFHFAPISPEDMTPRIRGICENEGLKYDEEGVVRLSLNAVGDMRNVVNWLQVMVSTKTPLTKDNFTSITRNLDLYEKIWDAILRGRFLEADRIAHDLMSLGYGEREIIAKMHERLINRDSTTINDTNKGECVLELAESDYRLTLGVSKGLQIDALLMRLINVLKKK